MVVKDDPVCSIKLDLTHAMLVVYCKQHMESEKLQQNILAMLDLIYTYKVKYLLGNLRALHYLSVKDANWLWDCIVPAVKASSVVKWARVEDPSSMLELNSLQIKARLEAENTPKSVLQFEAFVDEESALHWLLEEEE